MRVPFQDTFLLGTSCCLLFAMASGVAAATDSPRADTRPNIIFVLADDLGYGDLGCYGQQVIQTPHLDRLAREGMRFRQFYAGCTVCAPSRSVLMTGQHMGHTHVRGNASGDMSVQSLRAEDVTVAEALSSGGYQTGLCGKWGLGDELPGAEVGLPTLQGFDFFFGYLNQVHAHNYYPEFLWKDRQRVPLRNEVVGSGRTSGGFEGGHAVKRVDYSHDLILSQAVSFIEQHRDHPFFLYIPVTIPHANNEGTRATGNGQEVPDYGIYAERAWPEPDKGQAAMITRLDQGVGRIMDKLAELEIDDRTILMFSSDNGHHDEGGHDTDRFDPNGPLRGRKRDLYEGGIRVPMIVRWPGRTPAGTTTDHLAYFGDLIATACQLAGVETPADVDSISFVPTITGQPRKQQRHDFLYWEFYERGGKQAVRQQQWKAIRMPMFTGKTELYDLSRDLGEARDVAGEFPRIVEQLEKLMTSAHQPHPNWTPRGRIERQQPPPGDGRARF